ncbi:MAG TPA: class A beta-lactamase-related serine hydrolase [Chitinophagaceae bacterium]|nr:class A beta-lactamase-related serine hydrolase [Chitinophagaceae bacterium]
MQRLIFVLLFLIPMATIAQKTDKKLGLKIQEAIAGYNGDIGVYVKNLRTGRTIAINADTIFPTASIVKVQILAGITDKIEKGELQYNQEFVYKDSLLYEGSDILGSFKQDETITLKKLIMLMLTTSDNTASLWLQSIAGTGARINEIMESLGLHYTRVNSRVPGREEYRAIYQWGQTTPHEMATLFEMIYRKKVISPEASEKMMRQLSRNFWDDVALSQIPPTVEVFSKNGAVNASSSEVLLVNHHKTPYILSVFTKNNKDQSWETDNEAWVLTRKISKMVWDFYGDK